MIVSFGRELAVFCVAIDTKVLLYNFLFGNAYVL